MTTAKQPSTLAQAKNPILPGFYPDPSICRVGEDYYLVNSSFGFFPGVPIFHSRDLIHWEQIGHILDRPSQLNLTTQGISCGIYAPTLRYHNGTFFMVTTFIDGGGNFFVTAPAATGPWSDPVWLPDMPGIDPSFFFDDGKAYIIYNGPPPDCIELYKGHRAIWIQEFSLQSMTTVGKKQIIVNGGTDLAKEPIWIEGPHLFRRYGYYYLLAAEGGTEKNHTEVVFRSKSVYGPYEPFAGNPVLTQRDLPHDRKNPVTCTGHVDLVETPEGQWMAVFLACEPYEGDEYFNTGRQTFLLPVDWSGEWPIILPHGKTVPEVFATSLPAVTGRETFADRSAHWKDEFDGPELGMEWNFIRTPQEKWHALRDGALVMRARPVAITERGNPSFIGRRAQHAHSRFSAALRLEAGRDLEAGIVAIQNEGHLYKLLVVQNGDSRRVSVSSASAELFSTPLPAAAAESTIHLRMEMRGSRLQCFFSLDERTWTAAGEALDARQLSTSVAGGFVGAYFGLYAFAKSPASATFDRATYEAL